jgi:hypothetical protein
MRELQADAGAGAGTNGIIEYNFPSNTRTLLAPPKAHPRSNRKTKFEGLHRLDRGEVGFKVVEFYW